MKKAEILKRYLHRIAASKLILCGSNPQEVQEWQERLSEFDFVEPTDSSSTHAHAVLVIDPGYEMEWACSDWHTIVALYEGYTLEQASNHCFGAAIEDVHGWNGTSFDIISKRQRIRDVYNQQDFWDDSIIPAWPDMEPYISDTYLLYAGAGGAAISPRQAGDLLDEINEAFAAGYTRILFYNGDETLQAPSIMKCQRLTEYFDYSMYHELPKNTFIYVCGAPDANAKYNDLCSYYGFGHYMLVRGYFRFELLHKRDYNNLSPDQDSEMWEYLNTPYGPKIRPQKFLCFNRVPRPHRMMIASKMKQHGFLDKGFFSFYEDDCMDSVAMKQDFLDNFQWDQEYPTYQQANQHFCDFVDQDIPCVLNRTPDRDNPVSLTADDIDYYRDSYFSIVNETLFYKHDTMNLSLNFAATFLSEKSWKPIMMKHPFILIGPHRALNMLKNAGYQSFHPFIDETYDHVEDDHTRMEMAWQEITRLITMSDDEWLLIQKKIAPIIEHNFRHFTEYDGYNRKLYLDLDSIADYY